MDHPVRRAFATVAVLAAGPAGFLILRGGAPQATGTHQAAPKVETLGPRYDDLEYTPVEQTDISPLHDRLPSELVGIEAEFVASVEDTLLAFTFDDVGDFLTWQDRKGVNPIEPWASDLELGQRQWTYTRRVIQEARFAGMHTTARWINDRGSIEPPAGAGHVRFDATTRDKARRFLSSTNLAVVEVLLPGDFPSTVGDERIRADLGIEMTYDDASGAWAPSAFRVYYHDSGRTVNGTAVLLPAMPPL
ncbi:MAG: hypothetical protein AAGI53_00620 [Planctomycetota bacterium]